MRYVETAAHFGKILIRIGILSEKGKLSQNRRHPQHVRIPAVFTQRVGDAIYNSLTTGANRKR